jgi:hypothetical protein
MLWETSYVNPMVYYTEPVELPDNLRYYNLGIESVANGGITYRVIESSTSSFMTVYDRDPLTVTTYGTIALSTSSKFGTYSLSLPGSTSSYATIASTGLAFASGGFTIEAWVKLNTVSTAYQTIFANDVSGEECALYVNNNTITFRYGDFATIGSNSPGLSANTWYHIAVSCQPSTQDIRIFRDGYCEIVDSISNTGTNITSTTGYIGVGSGFFVSANPLDGYIDDLRISNTCRYLGSQFSQVFTAPAATLVNDTSTIFLCTAERGIVDTPNIIEEVLETVINDGDEGIPAFSRKYVMVGIEVDSSERGKIYSSKITPNQKRIDILLNDVDVTTLVNSTTTSTSKVLDLGRETSRVLAVFPQKSSGLDDVGLVPIVANKTEPAIAFIKATEGAQDYVYGGAAGAAVDPATLTSPIIDVVVHALPEQYMADGRLQTR